MNSELCNLLNQICNSLESTRKSVCVDGSAAYQHGFFDGFELAQRVVEDIAKRHGVEVNHDLSS